MTNLFAFRATDPRDLLAANEPVGPENNAVLLDLAQKADLIVAAWGTHGSHLGRDQAIRNMLPNMQCLDLTKEGHPSHPLYLPKTLQPRPFA